MNGVCQYRMVKATLLLTLLLVVAVKTCSQEAPNPFLTRLFMDLKNKDSGDFATHYVSGGQYEKLLLAHLKFKNITRDSLNNTSTANDSSYQAGLTKRFRLFLKQADSLGIDIGNIEYDSCKFEKADSPKSVCVSSRGIIYFSGNSKQYEWIINEALLIKGEWRIIDPGKIYRGNERGFLPAWPDALSAFGTFSKVKVRFTLASPPPITQKPPPPPPPTPPKGY